LACSAIFQTGESSFPTDEDAVLTARRAHVEVGFEERLADGIALAYGHTQVGIAQGWILAVPQHGQPVSEATRDPDAACAHAVLRKCETL
jgi:hypothetical protein